MSINKTVAILDACVLYPAPLRDLLISLASKGFFQAKWTNDIHNEWIRNILKKRPDLNATQLNRTRELMNQAIPDAMVIGHETLIKKLTLPDTNDKHVLAAAICARANTIVTFNLKDFPIKYLHRFELNRMHPDNFIQQIVEQNPLQACECIHQLRKKLKKPPKTTSEYINIIKKQSLLKTAALLAQHQHMI